MGMNCPATVREEAAKTERPVRVAARRRSPNRQTFSKQGFNQKRKICKGSQDKKDYKRDNNETKKFRNSDLDELEDGYLFINLRVTVKVEKIQSFLIGGHGRRKWEWLRWLVLAVTKITSKIHAKHTRDSSAIGRQGSVS
ncbi:hypothetical protein TNCV_4559781 [Trichonephila clavipes]|nr:hypothetical protein TNCV_4559781 [Trichonephila clavipes]